MENSLSRQGLRFRIALQVDTLDLCISVARRGLAHTIVPACAVYRLHHDADVSWAPVRSFYLTWALNENEARSHSPAVAEGRKVVLSTVATALQSTLWFKAEPFSR